MKIENITTKRLAIMSSIEEFLEEMKGNRDFYESWPSLYNLMTVDRLYTISVLNYFLCFVVNVCMIFGYKYNSVTKKTEFTSDAAKWIVYGLSLLIIIISFIVFMIWWFV